MANPSDFAFALQAAPSSRSTCHNCEDPIDLGSVRFGVWSYHDEIDWLKIWKFKHVGCVTTSEIEAALEHYQTVEGIPTLIKPGQSDIPHGRRQECNQLLSCILEGDPASEQLVNRLKSNPDQCVLDLIDTAKSRRIRTPGSKKQDKFDAAKAAIESVRDTTTGLFDVDEALESLTSKKTKGKSKAKKMKKRVRQLEAEIADSPYGMEQPPLRKKAKTSKGKKADQKKSSGDAPANAGSDYDDDESPQLSGGGPSNSNVKEEDGAPLNSASAPQSSAGGPASSSAAAAAGGSATEDTKIKAELVASASEGDASSPYAGPTTRSRSKRLRS